MHGIVISDENWEEFEPISAHCSDTHLNVRLANGVQISVPPWWYPSLSNGTKEARNDIMLSPSGLHWDELDEDLSIVSLLHDAKSPGAVPPAEAAE